MEEIVETGKRELRGEGNGGRTGRGEEWRNLVADVEDLVKKVANVDDEEIAEIRSKVQHTLERAKTSARGGAASSASSQRRTSAIRLWNWGVPAFVARI